MKVVIIVGPVGSSTANYIYNAKKYAAQARSYGATVVEIYSPNATWTRVKAAAQGAKVLIYLGHGNGSPSPYGAFSQYTKDGFGLNATAGTRQLQHEVLGRVLHPDRPSSWRPNAVVDPEPAVLRLGQFRVGLAEPDQDDRQAARRQLRRGLPPCRRAGRLRRRDHQRGVHPVRAVPDEPHDRLDLHELTELRSARYDFQFASSRTPGFTAWMAPKSPESLLPIGGRQPQPERRDGARQLTRPPTADGSLLPSTPARDPDPGPGRSHVPPARGGPGPGGGSRPGPMDAWARAA